MDEATDNELNNMLERIDAELIRGEVPVAIRPQQALALIWPDESFPVVAREVAEQKGTAAKMVWRVADWFEARYGQKIAPSTDLGQVPIVIRNEVFLARIPLAYGAPTMQPLDMIIGLTDGMRKSLRPHEAREVLETYSEGLALVYQLDDARRGLPQRPLPADAQELLVKAVNDRVNAARCFADRHDANAACVNAQQHAEKLMKLFLTLKGNYSDGQLRRIRHNMPKLLEECVAIEPAFSTLGEAVDTVAQVSMDYRYTTPAVPIQDAVRVFWAALRIGATAVCEALDLDRRGADMRFIPPPGYDKRLAEKRRELVAEQWPHIVANYRVAAEAWGEDVTVLVLDLRDDRARDIARTLQQPIDGELRKLDAPGNHLLSAFLTFGLPREDAMRHVAFNRTTAVQGFDDPAPAGEIMVSIVSDRGYETFCVPEDGLSAT